nr:glycoside hydrolase family 43 protein [Planctomonas sp. JC2975]
MPGFHPDPTLCRVGDRYYLANSTFEYVPGIPIHESTDLRTWRPIGSAILRPEEFDLADARDSGGIYAPTLRFHDGRFYLVAAQVDRAGDTQFVMSARHPAGPWSAPVWVADADGFDPSLFFHAGRAYWCAARILDAEAGRTAIWVREFDLETGRLVGHESVIWTGALRNAVWSEGPHLYEHDGWFYLLTAEGGTYRDHSVVVARSRSITGPYEQHLRNPLFTHRHLGRGYPVQNVGHADLVERPDGTWVAVLLAVRSDDGRHILGRETFVAEVTWEDGWPVINGETGVLTDVGDRPVEWNQNPARIGSALTVRRAADFAEETAEGVVLTDPARATDRHDTAPAALFHRLQHRAARMSVSFDDIAAGAAVGLMLRQSDAHSIRIEVHGDVVRIIERRGGVDTVRDRWAREARHPLAIDAELRDSAVRFHVDGRTSAGLDTAALSSEVAGGFVGTMWGPFVVRGTALRAQARVRSLGYRSLLDGEGQIEADLGADLDLGLDLESTSTVAGSRAPSTD